MVALSFQKQFAAPILAGRKTHTIRAPRKVPVRAGQALQLYTGMRTRFCAKIGDANCVGTVAVVFDFPENTVKVGGALYSGWKMLDDFAVSDGFETWLDMRAFWAKNHANVLVFEGTLIRWVNFVAAPGRLARGD